jgi:glycosyltransferase involved in cell wall biosynthesis
MSANMRKLKINNRRVLYIHHGTVLGGAPVSLLHLLAGLKAISDLDIRLFCRAEGISQFFQSRLNLEVGRIADPLTLLGNVLIWGVAPLEFKKRRLFIQDLIKFPWSVFSQWRCIRRERPALVHLSSAVLFSSAAAARLAGVPIVWHIREMLAGGRFSIRRKFAGWLIRRLADRVIVCSPPEAERLEGQNDKHVHVVYHPIDFKYLNPDEIDKSEARKRLRIDENQKVLISLGGVSHWKGTVPILEAMSHTDAQTHLYFAGQSFSAEGSKVNILKRWMFRWEDKFVRDGRQDAPIIHYRDRVRLAWDKAPKDRIHFLGFLEDVRDLIAAADVVIFAGMAPHYPRGVFEAYAMARPVVVFDVDGIRQKVIEGVTGVIVPHRTGEALGQAVRELLENPGLCISLGEQGRQYAMQLCDRDQTAKQVLDVYDDLLANGPSPAKKPICNLAQ